MACGAGHLSQSRGTITNLKPSLTRCRPFRCGGGWCCCCGHPHAASPCGPCACCVLCPVGWRAVCAWLRAFPSSRRCPPAVFFVCLQRVVSAAPMLTPSGTNPLACEPLGPLAPNKLQVIALHRCAYTREDTFRCACAQGGGGSAVRCSCVVCLPPHLQTNPRKRCAPCPPPNPATVGHAPTPPPPPHRSLWFPMLCRSAGPDPHAAKAPPPPPHTHPPAPPAAAPTRDWLWHLRKSAAAIRR